MITTYEIRKGKIKSQMTNPSMSPSIMSLVTISSMSSKSITIESLSSPLLSNWTYNNKKLTKVHSWSKRKCNITIYKIITKRSISWTNRAYRLGTALRFNSVSRALFSMCSSTLWKIFCITLHLWNHTSCRCIKLCQSSLFMHNSHDMKLTISHGLQEPRS